MLAKCKICKRMYESYGSPICNKCMTEMDEQYKVVRDYLYDNPDAMIDQVCEDTKIPERVIMYFLKDGRIRMSKASGLLKCERCGAAIETGKLCDDCAVKVGAAIGESLGRLNSRAEGPRMHTST